MNIPSDLDLSKFFSDNIPPSDILPPSEILLPSEYPPDSPLNGYLSDDLVALHEVSRERDEQLSKEGAVIRHRVCDQTPVFRSSSLPPVSPTPTPRPNYHGRFPVSPNPYAPLSPIQSSPPTMTSSPIMLHTPETSELLPPANPQRLKPFTPNFNLPLAGSFLSKKSFLTKPKPGVEEPIPTQEPPQLIAAKGVAPPAPPRFGTTRPLGAVKIVSSNGKSTYVERCRKEQRLEDTASEKPSGRAGSYFGIDIHSLLDECSLEKQASTQKPEAPLTQTEEIGKSRKRKKRLLWTEKYRAKKFTDLVGDERTHRHVMHWLKGWDPIVFPSGQKPVPKKASAEEEPERRKILLLHGPPGLGKTTLAHVAARQAGYESLEINASDDRSGAVVKGKIKDVLTTEGVKNGMRSGKNQTTTARPVCLVVDEIDGVTGGDSGGGDGSFIKALIDLLLEDRKASGQLKTTNSTSTTQKGRKKKETLRLMRPIIAICNDLYAPALKPLRAIAEVVQMRVPPQSLIEERLEWIFDREGYSTEDGAVRKIVDLSSGGGTGGQAGDMRSSLVNAEWICAKLQHQKTKPSVMRKSLTRKIVEEELEGNSVGKNDGKKSSRGRFGVRNAIEAVFQLEKVTGRSQVPLRETSAQRVRGLVEGLGEFDKITMDCFTTYPTRGFHDDFCLTKPNTAYGWLYFADLISSRVFNEQAYELSSYLSQPIVAFHHLFASATAPSKDADADNPDNQPFTGMLADWEAREATKERTAVIQSIQSSLTSIRLAQTFKSPCTIATELAPYVNCMLCPQINPVVVGGGSGFGAASVRRESEKHLVTRAVSAMEATGIQFEKLRIDSGPVGGGWAYRMEPSLDSLGLYPTLSNRSKETVRYAVRQVLDQEWKKACVLKEQAAREARMGKLYSAESANGTTAPTNQKRERTGRIKKDFFGRVIVEPDEDEEDGGNTKKRRTDVGERKSAEVWVSYHEGFSNAVRKPIRLRELLDGL